MDGCKQRSVSLFMVFIAGIMYFYTEHKVFIKYSFGMGLWQAQHWLSQESTVLEVQYHPVHHHPRTNKLRRAPILPLRAAYYLLNHESWLQPEVFYVGVVGRLEGMACLCSVDVITLCFPDINQNCFLGLYFVVTELLFHIQSGPRSTATTEHNYFCSPLLSDLSVFQKIQF